METIKNIYRIGNGPSSSHTMGPKNAANRFAEQNPNAHRFEVTLYGSLAATGKGHLTDITITNTLHPTPVKIIWEPDTELPYHPNGMLFEAFDDNNNKLDSWTIFSVGGGDLESPDKKNRQAKCIYKLSSLTEIIAVIKEKDITLWEYVFENEPALHKHLSEVWKVMQENIYYGISNEGLLPGGLNLKRKASDYHTKAIDHNGYLQKIGFIIAYALAVAEENACGAKIVTAPTCGSAGVLPAALYFLKKTYDFSDEKIIQALATAGLIGNLIKENASVSGAEVGCQGEIGSACSMAAAAATQLLDGSIQQIEYAAEMGMEHHLGLTCDPVKGLVQIPCIERTAVAAVRAIDCATFALFSDGKHRISFDKVILTMAQTGKDLKRIYRETSEGGLAFFSGI